MNIVELTDGTNTGSNRRRLTATSTSIAVREMTGNRIGRAVENYASCGVCTNPFDEDHHIPKSLSCGHTLCSHCVEIMLTTQYGMEATSTSINCPTCRASMSVATGRWQDIPTNYDLQNLLHETKMATKDLKVSLAECFGCGLQGNESMFRLCIDCCTLSDMDLMKPNLLQLQQIERHALCASCALDGHNSEKHRLVSFTYFRVLRDSQDTASLLANHETSLGKLKSQLKLLPVVFEDISRGAKRIQTYAISMNSSAALRDLKKTLSETNSSQTALISKLINSLEPIINDLQMRSDWINAKDLEYKKKRMEKPAVLCEKKDEELAVEDATPKQPTEFFPELLTRLSMLGIFFLRFIDVIFEQLNILAQDIYQKPQKATRILMLFVVVLILVFYMSRAR